MRALVSVLAAGALVGTVSFGAFAAPKSAWNAARAEYTLPPDLTVDFSADVASVRVASQLTYTAYVINNGRTAATVVHLHIVLPGNVQVILTATDRGPGCSPEGDSGLDCALGAIPAGQAAVITVKVVVTAGGTLVATALATEHEIDRHPKDNKASVTTSVTSGGGGGGGGAAPAAPAAGPVPAAGGGIGVVNVTGSGAGSHVTSDSTLKIGGTGSKDKITGTAGSDVIDGKGGNDVINGGQGKDTINGGAGNDVITGGPGADTIYGGAGNDTIYAKDGTRDMIDCGAGRDTVYADKKDSVARNCEIVRRS